MTELIRWVDYNLSTGANDGTSEADAFRGVDALNYAITNMDTYAKECTVNDHKLRVIIKGVGQKNTSNTCEPIDDSYLTDNSRRVQIEVDEREMHSGFIDASKFLIYVVDDGGDTIWLIQNSYQNVSFKNMQFQFHNWGGFQLWSSNNSTNNYVFENCLLDGKESPRYNVVFSTRGFNNTNAYLKCVNCIFTNFNLDYPGTHGCINFNWQSTSTQMFFYNCQFNNVETVIYDNYSTTAYGNVTYINCMFDDVNKLIYSGTFTYITENENCKNNSSNTALNVVTGSNNISNQVFTFEDEASDVYLITVEDTGASRQGVDNSVNGYSTDILGNEQHDPWDIGAYSGYEIPPEPTPTPTPIITGSRQFEASCFVDKNGNSIEWGE